MRIQATITLVLAAVSGSEAVAAQDLLQEFKGTWYYGWFGFDLGNLGDVDGDGLPELVIGAQYEEGAGQVYVYSAATGQLLYRLRGENYSDDFGEWVDATGDLDGDGFGDFVVGADENDFAGNNYGRVYAYSGTTGTLLWTVEGTCGPVPTFPAVMSAAGDVDGDGAGDVLVTEIGGCGGFVHVYSGVTGTKVASLQGEPRTYFGLAHSGVGDLDGDGYGDFVVGAPRAPGRGRAFVYSGRTLAPLWIADAERQGEYFGGSVGGLGDLDGDGSLELGIADQSFKRGSGRVYVYGADGSLRFTLDGPSRLGWRFAAAGDVDGDAVGDLIATVADGVLVYSGHDQSILFAFDDSRGDRLGSGMAGLGDLDGDGLSDFAIGAYYATQGIDPRGRVYVYTGPRYPVLAQVSPFRTPWSIPVPVTVTGSNFSRGKRTGVWFGPQAAANVQVLDDNTITCDAPASVPGPVRVLVKNSVGSGGLTNGFAYTPALILGGDLRPGGSLLARYLVDPGDQVFAIWGFPPPASIPWPPFSGNLCIDPFRVLFLTRATADEVQWSAGIPDSPGAPHLQALFQALAGPSLTGPGRSGAWTNCAEWTVR